MRIHEKCPRHTITHHSRLHRTQEAALYMQQTIRVICLSHNKNTQLGLKLNPPSAKIRVARLDGPAQKWGGEEIEEPQQEPVDRPPLDIGIQLVHHNVKIVREDKENGDGYHRQHRMLRVLMGVRVLMLEHCPHSARRPLPNLLHRRVLQHRLPRSAKSHSPNLVLATKTLHSPQKTVSNAVHAPLPPNDPRSQKRILNPYRTPTLTKPRNPIGKLHDELPSFLHTKTKLSGTSPKTLSTRNLLYSCTPNCSVVAMSQQPNVRFL